MIDIDINVINAEIEDVNHTIDIIENMVEFLKSTYSCMYSIRFGQLKRYKKERTRLIEIKTKYELDMVSSITNNMERLTF